MVVSAGVIMEQVDEDFVICHKRASDEWIREFLDRHSVIVEAQLLVEVYLVCLNLPGVSSLFTEGPQFEYTIVLVDNSIKVTLEVLLHLLELDVVVGGASHFLLKSHLVIGQIVHFDEVGLIVFLCDGDGPRGVVSNDH